MKKNTRKQIEMELERARLAQSDGNHGMARVCCRRAAGEAIRSFAEAYPAKNFGQNAMSALDQLSRDADIPAFVREAAMRLRGKNDGSMTNFSADPINDAESILSFIDSAYSDNSSRDPEICVPSM
jgi:hypothetical protein